MDATLVDGEVETYAGTGTNGFRDGVRAEAMFSSFWSCCVAPNDVIFIGDLSNNVIRRVDAHGLVTTYAGDGKQGNLDGARLMAQFHGPAGLCMTSSGELLVSDKNNQRIRKISEEEVVITIAGSGKTGSNDGPAMEASFQSPIGICESPMGILVADWFSHRIRLIADGIVSTFAGTGVEGFVNDERLSAQFAQPVGVVCDPQTGHVYVADRNNHAIRSISPTGTVTTLAGNGERGSADGTLAEARFASPWSLCLSPVGDIIIADEYNNKIRAINTNEGLVSTLAGDGEKGLQNGAGRFAQFAFPACVSLSQNGDLFVADRSNQVLRRMHFDRWMVKETTNRRLSLLGLRDADFLSDVTLELKPNSSWNLHSFVLQMRCPMLLDKEVQQNLRNSNFSTNTINSFIELLYGGSVPKLTTSEICELETLATSISNIPLADQLRKELRTQLAPMSVDNILVVLKHVTLNSGGNSRLLHLMVPYLRLRRANLLPRFDIIRAWFPSESSRFQEVFEAILGNQPVDQHDGAAESDSPQLDGDLASLYSETCPNSDPTSLAQAWRNTDFSLKIDDFEIACHKWVLCARWLFARDALAFGGSESETSTMELPSECFSPSVLRNFVKYLYTNDVADFIDEDECLAVLKLASQFRLWDSSEKPAAGFDLLLRHCRASLLKNLSLTNSVDVYKRVLEHGSRDQQASVRTFILRHIQEIAEIPGMRAALESLGSAELVRLLVTNS